MSLINEALKKAQRQRTEAPVSLPPPAPAGATDAPVARIAKRRPPMPARTQILLIGGGGAVLLMAGVLAFVFLGEAPVSPPPTKPALVAPAPVAVTPPVAPAAPAPAPTPVPATAPVAPAPVAVQLPPVVPVAPVQAPTPVVFAPVAPVAPVVPPKPAVPATPVSNLKVYEFLETLRISGIRMSDTDPKVIMNDRVFRLNDVVDRNLQLKLLRVEPGVLIFVDAAGFEYRKNF